MSETQPSDETQVAEVEYLHQRTLTTEDEVLAVFTDLRRRVTSSSLLR